MGKLQDIIYVRDCNSVNGCLPVSSEPNGVFKEVKYIRADLAQPVPASDAVQRACTQNAITDFETIWQMPKDETELWCKAFCENNKETILAALRGRL